MEEVESSPNCDEKSADQFEHYTTQMAGNTIQLMCSEYDADSDKCGRVLKLAFVKKDVKVPSSLIKAFGNLFADN